MKGINCQQSHPLNSQQKLDNCNELQSFVYNVAYIMASELHSQTAITPCYYFIPVYYHIDKDSLVADTRLKCTAIIPVKHTVYICMHTYIHHTIYTVYNMMAEHFAEYIII